MNRSLFLLSLGFVGLCNSTDITSSHSFDDDESTKVIVHSTYLHRLGAENGIVTFSPVQKKKTRSRKLLSMIKTKKNSKGFVFKSKKNEQEAPGDPADLSSDAGKKLNQKDIETLTKKVHDSRVKVGAQVAAHTQLEEQLNAAMLAGGKLTPVQSHHWHGEVHTYTPKHNKWLTLPAWNGKACAIGVITGPGGHCHRDRLHHRNMQCKT